MGVAKHHLLVCQANAKNKKARMRAMIMPMMAPMALIGTAVGGGRGAALIARKNLDFSLVFSVISPSSSLCSATHWRISPLSLIFATYWILW